MDNKNKTDKKSNKEINDYTNASISAYSSLLKLPTLSAEEELDLFKRVKGEDKTAADSARETIIAHNMKLVVKIASKYRTSCQDLVDAVNEGVQGLHRAITDFDATRGLKFSTYAFTWILNYVQHEYKFQNPDITGISLDAEVGSDSDDGDTKFGELIEDKNAHSPSETSETSTLNSTILTAMQNVLDPREIEVVSLYFGLVPKLPGCTQL